MASLVARTRLNVTVIRILPVLLNALFNLAVNCFTYIASVIREGMGVEHW